MTDRLNALLDIEDIRNLRILYSHYLDSGNANDLHKIFAQDALVEVTVGAMRGLSEIQSGLGEAFTTFDRDKRGRFPFFHAVTNHWVKLTGPDTAEGLCYLIDFETASKPDPNPLLLLGLYADAYRRIDGEWRITHSRLETVWPEANGGGGRPGEGLKLPS
jgi:hypothetical protein